MSGDVRQYDRRTDNEPSSCEHEILSIIYDRTSSEIHLSILFLRDFKPYNLHVDVAF